MPKGKEQGGPPVDKKQKKTKEHPHPEKIDKYQEHRQEREINQAAKWSMLNSKAHLGAPHRIPLGSTDAELDDIVTDENATVEVQGQFKLYRLAAEIEETEEEE